MTIQVDAVDNLTPDERSRNMAAIKSKNTKPEIIVRKFLHKNGFRFRLHSSSLPGKPDVILKKYKTVIFVNGCFWHQHKNCEKSKIPKTNRKYWIAKFQKNKLRDVKNFKEIREKGWNIIVIWECQAKDENILNQVLQNGLFSKIKSYTI